MTVSVECTEYQSLVVVDGRIHTDRNCWWFVYRNQQAKRGSPDVVVATWVVIGTFFQTDEAAAGILAADEIKSEVLWGQVKDLHSSVEDDQD